jgi:hypothetical protein
VNETGNIVQPTEEGKSVLESAARHATMRTPVTEFGLSVEALDVLARMGIHVAQRLLEVPRIRFCYLSGVSERVRQEIWRAAKELARRRTDLIPGAPSPSVNGTGSLDRLAEQFLPKDDRLEDQLVGAYLAIELSGEGDGDQRLSVWPVAQEGLPAIDGVPVSVIGAFQWARLPEAWARSMHHAGTA